MHDIGQSKMEQPYGEYGTHSEGAYEYAGESPLQEILEQSLHEGAFEATLGEDELHEGAYEFAQAEAAYESPYHESSFEAPYGETAFEAPYQETGETYGEAPAVGYETGEYQESSSYGEVVSEEEELALASELLEVQGEDELDQFLGKLVRRVARGVPGFARSPMGRALGGVLGKVARVAVPMAGRALGTFVGGPAGAMIGGQLANMASRAMGLELTEMAPQEADLTAARQFVRFASHATRAAELAGPSAAPAQTVGRAVQGAAHRYAPGLVSPRLPRVRLGPTRSRGRGVWVRRGRTIILYGV